MVSHVFAKSIIFQDSLKDMMKRGSGDLISKINQLKKEIGADRAVQIKVNFQLVYFVFCRYV